MTLPAGYEEKVYSGVLGKIIGVYLGRPFEGWNHQRIINELGEINYYVHEKLGVPLIVSDDDISGTFTFVRALEDYGFNKDISPEQIGQTWLNYIIENRSILWWGGLGNSTEHTAFLRLKNGIPAPISGSIKTNGKVVAEQIGSQIFIDSWGMVAPGDPDLAASLAKKAASVSHDGEAIHGAQVIASMEAAAFVEKDLDKLLDIGLSYIPKKSIIYTLISNLRELHSKEKDWYKARQWLDQNHGYHKYPGNCHIIPNHGLVILSLLYGEDNFQKSLMIVNTSGWDTDCNSGNVGCLMGIKNGLEGIEQGPDYRTPVADQLYLPTADSGRVVTDAVIEAYKLINTARSMNQMPPLNPKGGARFHFEMPGSVQGFTPELIEGSEGKVSITNSEGISKAGKRVLTLSCKGITPENPIRVSTPTFIIPIGGSGYNVQTSPTLYPTQSIRAGLVADYSNNRPVECRIFTKSGSFTEPQYSYSPVIEIDPNEYREYQWEVPSFVIQPILTVGIEILAPTDENVVLHMDYLTWDGVPTLSYPLEKADPLYNWVNGVDRFGRHQNGFTVTQNRGIGLIIQGAREWSDYIFEANIYPYMCKSAGIACNVQGMRRYYALTLCDGNKIKLFRALDGYTTLQETSFPWEVGNTYNLALQVRGNQLVAYANGELLFTVDDDQSPLTTGAIGVVCEEGHAKVMSALLKPCK